MANNDQGRLRDAVTTGTRIATGATIPFCLVVAVLARPALIAWVGRSYVGAAPAASLLACAFALDSIATIPRQVLSGTGEQRTPALIAIAAAIVEISLVAGLGYAYGITGVGVATLIAVILIELGTVPLVCRRLDMHASPLFGSVARAHVPPVLVAGALGWFLSTGSVSHYVDGHGRLAGLVAVVLAGGVVLVVYAGVFAVSGLRGDERSRLLARMHPSQEL